MANRVWLLWLLLFSLNAQALPKISIFDIDDTLVNVSYRTLEIFRESAYLFNPPLVALATLPLEKVDYNCDVTLRNALITDPAVVSRLCGTPTSYKTSEWGKKFFSAPYLRYNKVISGAPDFVAKFSAETGSIPFYVTGRDVAELGMGTLAELKYYGFSALKDLVAPGKNLILKPSADPRSDVEFKRSVVRDLRERYLIVAAFDDNPANAEMFAKELGHTVPVVRPVQDLESESAEASAALGIRLITTYFYNAKGRGHKISYAANRSVLEEIIADAKKIH